MTDQPGARRASRPQVLATEELATALRDAICGPRNLGRPEVIWSDGGSQIMLHVGKLQVRTAGSALLVAVDTESAEFGVAPLIVRFVFGTDQGPASLVAATDDQALGHPQVAARWGDLFRDVTWAALTRLIDARSTRAGSDPGSGDHTGSDPGNVSRAVPGAIQIFPDGLRLTVQNAFSTVDLAVEHVKDLAERGLRGRPAGSGGPAAPSTGGSSGGPPSGRPGGRRQA